MDKDKLIEGLNSDLNREIDTIIRYLFQSSILKGHVGREVRELLEEDITGEVKHAQFLADKIVALGGTPKIMPSPPPENVTQWLDILKYDLDIERQAIAAYKERAKQAEQFGDIGLKTVLEKFVQDETEHAETMERFIGGEQSTTEEGRPARSRSRR